LRGRLRHLKEAPEVLPVTFGETVGFQLGYRHPCGGLGTWTECFVSADGAEERSVSCVCCFVLVRRGVFLASDNPLVQGQLTVAGVPD
jgi:hypothetical protein